MRFFVNLSAVSSIRVCGEKATLFYPEDLVQIDTQEFSIRLSFSIDSKEGAWTGHILKGNRSCQKDKSPLACYDWKIAWRTLRRQPEAKARIYLEITW